MFSLDYLAEAKHATIDNITMTNNRNRLGDYSSSTDVGEPSS